MRGYLIAAKDLVVSNSGFVDRFQFLAAIA